LGWAGSETRKIEEAGSHGRAAVAAGHYGEQQHGKAGQQVGVVAGDEGNPFWGGGEEKAHREMHSMVRQPSRGKLTVVGRR
jgi:hypothetical protein